MCWTFQPRTDQSFLVKDWSVLVKNFKTLVLPIKNHVRIRNQCSLAKADSLCRVIERSNAPFECERTCRIFRWWKLARRVEHKWDKWLSLPLWLPFGWRSCMSGVEIGAFATFRHTAVSVPVLDVPFLQPATFVKKASGRKINFGDDSWQAASESDIMKRNCPAILPRVVHWNSEDALPVSLADLCSLICQHFGNSDQRQQSDENYLVSFVCMSLSQHLCLVFMQTTCPSSDSRLHQNKTVHSNGILVIPRKDPPGNWKNLFILAVPR